MAVHQTRGPGQGNLTLWVPWGNRYQRAAVIPDPDYWEPLPCGCPSGVVIDEGHQEGCEYS